MKRTAIAVTLALLGLLLMPAAVSAAGIQVVAKTGDGAWTDNTWQVEIYPGETKSTTLSLYNSSSSSLSVDVSVTPDSLDNGNLSFELDKTNFTMIGGSHIDVTLSVKTNGSATPGTYTAELEIKSEVPPSPPSFGGFAPDSTPPRIYNTSLCAIGNTTADLCWTTNEPATSQVEYWTSPSTLSPLDKKYVTRHRVHLTDLTPGTIYHYKMMSEDRAGNLKVSDKHTFTTLGAKPVPEPAPEPAPEPEPAPPEEPEPVVPEPTKPEPILPSPEEPAPEEPAPWPWIGGGIGAAAIAGGVWYWLWRRRKEATHG